MKEVFNRNNLTGYAKEFHRKHMSRAVSKILWVRGKKENGYLVTYQDKNGIALSASVATQEEIDTMTIGVPVDVSAFYSTLITNPATQEPSSAPIRQRNKPVRVRKRKKAKSKPIRIRKRS